MKTITLTDEAYERIAALKTSPKDSFSKVLLRTLPKRGTAAQLLAAVSQLPALSEAEARTMEEVASKDNDWKNWGDPWTTSSTRTS